MIHFPILRTRRLTVQLRELTIGEALALAAMPGDQDEAACSAFLGHVVSSVKGIEDPAQWTVQERTLAVCHYLAATADDGPDFAVGPAGHYADYLDGAADYPATEIVEAGEVGGDHWRLRHLTGAMAQAIERLHGEVEGVAGRVHWLLGGMAAQLVSDGGEPDPAAGEGTYDEHLIGRMRVFAAYPESDFAALMGLYLDARERLHHLFRLDFAPDGIVALPKGGPDGGLPPARFPVRVCLSGLARDLGR